MQHKHATCTDYKYFYTLLHMTHHTHPVRKRTHTLCVQWCTSFCQRICSMQRSILSSFLYTVSIY